MITNLTQRAIPPARQPRGRRRGAVNLRAALLGVALGTVAGLGALYLVTPMLTKTSAAPPSAAESPAFDVPVSPTVEPEPPKPQVDLARLNDLLQDVAGKIQGDVAIHVRLEGGVHAGVRADEPMPAASVIKLPIMVVLHDAWHAGTLQRTEKDAEQARQAITVSDNPAADWLIDRLGMSQINSWLEDHGYPHTRVRHKMAGPQREGPNLVTAAEMTRMLLEIASGTLVSAEASAEMREVLLAQTRRTRIPAGLPEGVTVGNKTGTLRGITNDVAFVETPEGLRYAIAVLVANGGEDVPTSRRIAEVSRKVHEFLTNSGAESPAAL